MERVGQAGRRRDPEDQLDGEHWTLYFKRRTERNAETEKGENTKAKQSRKGKLNTSLHFKLTKENKVYHWKKTDRSGFRKRVEVNVVFEDRQSFFFEFGKKQKVYDSFSDSWDLCTEFGEEDENVFRWPDDGDRDDDTPHMLTPRSGTPTSSLIR